MDDAVARSYPATPKIHITARIAMSEAVLFVPPDGVDRDPDLSEKSDRKAIRLISAAEYIQAREKAKEAGDPAWALKGNHRLYCPECFEKGFLSRRKGVIAHYVPLGVDAVVAIPDSFAKYQHASDHMQTCSLKRYEIEISEENRLKAKEAAETRRHIHTIPIATDPATPKPPRPLPVRRGSVIRTKLNPQSYRPSLKAPPLRNMQDIANVIILGAEDPKMWDSFPVHTPNGDFLLKRIYFNDHESLRDFCLTHRGQSPHVVVSLKPNRYPKFWEGNRFRAQAKYLGKDAGGKKQYAEVFFVAATDDIAQNLRKLFRKTGLNQGSHVLFYGRVQLNSEGHPQININRATQIIDWNEPGAKVRPKEKTQLAENMVFEFSGAAPGQEGRGQQSRHRVRVKPGIDREVNQPYPN